MERDVKEFVGRREQFKKRKFDSGVRASRQRFLETTTIVEQSRAQTSSGGARFSSSRGIRSPRGRGSWRPSVRSTSSRSNNTGGVTAISVELRDI